MPLRRRGSDRSPDAEMTVIEHIGELRRRLLICVVAVVIGAIITYFYSLQIIHFFIRYYEGATDGERNTLIFLGPLDAFGTRLKIAMYGGVVLALPVWLYQLWRFITPGLSPKEKKYAIPFVASAIALFIVGALVALVTLEPALTFLLGLGGSELTPTLAADKYLSLVALMIVAFGIAFQFPVVLMFLLIARVISTAQLRRWRRYTAVIIVTFAAVITPSQDPYSLLFMAVPMYIFYEMSILIGRLIKR